MEIFDRMTLVFKFCLALFLLNMPLFQSVFGQGVDNFTVDSVVYNPVVNLEDIKLEDVQGIWCSDEENILINDSIWDSNLSNKKYKLAIHSLVSDVDSFTMMHLCNQCISFTENDGIPEDEVILYKVLDYTNNMLKVENFLTHHIKVLIKCD